ncbi:hypothetical protein R1sor_025216 [Riccia sorocarpa]|uniref:Reverse transcriptase domain-containing protein n=1 Tax=Riccia sorocarpa TaxID=122646 RepID=A0ABD3G801_9MARC
MSVAEDGSAAWMKILTEGSSNLLNGAELRAWKDLARFAELVDCYFLALRRKGPRFTHQKLRKDRMEFARLDRVYISDGVDWLEQIVELLHDGTSGLSNHYLIKVSLQWKGEEEVKRQWRTYFKFRHQEMQTEEVKLRITDIWNKKPKRVTDAHIQWELGWQRVKKLMQEIRRESRSKGEDTESLSSQLLKVRERIAAENTAENQMILATLEAKVKEQEIKNATAWRLRSRSRWLKEGDAPSHYFFAMMRSKFKREMIETLTTDEGEVLTSQEDILTEAHSFYQSLFQEEQGEDEEQRETHTRHALQLLKNKVTAVQNSKLAQVPDMEELERIVKLLPPDKAPGLDGVTSEVVQEHWELVKEDCKQMIESFWTDGKLMDRTKKGAIKLIPKMEDKARLKDWRPISLLGITYKIISKLLAERLKSLLPGLVNEQQTGFVQGRSIFDSILTVKLGQEWASVTSQQSIFLKLDFVKPYDRVRHQYLWRVLESMGFCSKFLLLLQGLVEDAHSVIHINGTFTWDIKLERGVRQGCPIAPLLFALFTQPLMAMLREAQVQGEVPGLEVGNSRQILDALFADDIGLILQATEENWRAATSVVQRFEVISGAKLNVSKSLVLPIGFREPPPGLELQDAK